MSTKLQVLALSGSGRDPLIRGHWSTAGCDDHFALGVGCEMGQEFLYRGSLGSGAVGSSRRLDNAQ